MDNNDIMKPISFNPPKTPFVLIGDRATYCDIDNTLVFSHMDLHEMGISPLEADTRFRRIMVESPFDGSPMERYVNQQNLDLLIAVKMSNAAVVAWSQGGFKWAQNVVQALGIEQYVDAIASKPTFIIDDLQASEFMPKSVWKKPV